MDDALEYTYFANVGGTYLLRIAPDMKLQNPENKDWDRAPVRYERMGARLCVYLTNNSNKDNESP